MSPKYRQVRAGRRFVLSIAAGALASSCAVSRAPDQGQTAAGSAATSGNIAGHPPGTMVMPGVVPHPPGTMVQTPGTVIYPGAGVGVPSAGVGGWCSNGNCTTDAGVGVPVHPVGTVACPPELCPRVPDDGGTDD